MRKPRPNTTAQRLTDVEATLAENRRVLQILADAACRGGALNHSEVNEVRSVLRPPPARPKPTAPRCPVCYAELPPRRKLHRCPHCEVILAA